MPRSVRDLCPALPVASATRNAVKPRGQLGPTHSATGVDGDQADDSDNASGAVYMFGRDGELWSQRSYIKASNSGETDYFGWEVALSGDGTTLAVGAPGEDGPGWWVNDDQDNDLYFALSGAAYVFVAPEGSWNQVSYVKASNAYQGNLFGWADSNTLAVGAIAEQSRATGVGGDEDDNFAEIEEGQRRGAVYLY